MLLIFMICCQKWHCSIRDSNKIHISPGYNIKVIVNVKLELKFLLSFMKCGDKRNCSVRDSIKVLILPVCNVVMLCNKNLNFNEILWHIVKKDIVQYETASKFSSGAILRCCKRKVRIRFVLSFLKRIQKMVLLSTRQYQSSHSSRLRFCDVVNVKYNLLFLRSLYEICCQKNYLVHYEIVVKFAFRRVEMLRCCVK